MVDPTNNTWRGWRVVASVVGVALVGGVIFAVGGRAPARAATTVAKFSKPGLYTWKVPKGVTKVTFIVYGASGGNVSDQGALVAIGGAGGETKATFPVAPGMTFYVAVGARGGDGSETSAGMGGLPGGDDGAKPGGDLLGGGGGGGESAVYLTGSGFNCLTVGLCSDPSRRIVVGGGGGGALATVTGDAADGGAGGGLQGLPNGRGGGQFCCIPNGSTSETGVFPSGGGGWLGGNDSLETSSGLLSAGGGSGFYNGLATLGSFPGHTRIGNGLVTIQTG